MKNIIKYILIIGLIIIIIVTLINIYIIMSTKTKIETKEKLTNKDIDCIIVLGAGVKNNQPSPMLEDRLLTAVDLYNQNITNKIIVSGDHEKKHYDEVNVMKQFLIAKNIPSENIFMDHAGFSTYDSIYRAKEIFQAKKVIIVTQEYHLYRALHIADKLDLEAYGISANRRDYSNQIQRDIREIIARVKDYFNTIFKPKPKYLGNNIPVNGNGDITNDI